MGLLLLSYEYAAKCSILLTKKESAFDLFFDLFGTVAAIVSICFAVIEKKLSFIQTSMSQDKLLVIALGVCFPACPIIHATFGDFAQQGIGFFFFFQRLSE